jgi:hypothetical protein
MSKKHTVPCACGAVKFRFDVDPDFVAVCHCLDYKIASGGEAATFLGVAENDFTLLSGQPKAFHYTAASATDGTATSSWTAARECLAATWAFRARSLVAIGSLDNPEGIRLMLEMFVNRRFIWATPLDLP